MKITFPTGASLLTQSISQEYATHHFALSAVTPLDKLPWARKNAILMLVLMVGLVTMRR